MLGFTYNGIHSNVYGLYCKTVNRTLLPSSVKKEFEIPGKHGTYDQYNNMLNNRIIEVEIVYVGTSMAELRTRARDIAKWLKCFDSVKQLIFDDEPLLYYNTRIFDEVALNNLFLKGISSITFECEPFAYSTLTDEITKMYNETWQYDDDNIYDNQTEFTWTLPFQMTGLNNYSVIRTPLEIVITGSISGPYNIFHNETNVCVTRTANITTQAIINNFELVSGANGFLFGCNLSNAIVSLNWSHRWL